MHRAGGRSGLRAALASLEIPIVETWATPAGPLDSAVLYANIDTGRLAARHFADRNYARVACVSADTPWERERRQGFIETARSLGLELAADIIQPEACQPNDGRMAFLRLLATNTLFDAVFASSDLLAAGAVFEAHHRDLHVPQDVAVLGVSEDGSAAQWAPGLSTLTASAELAGAPACCCWNGWRAIATGRARRAGSGPGSAAQHLNAAGRRTDGEAGTKQAA